MKVFIWFSRLLTLFLDVAVLVLEYQRLGQSQLNQRKLSATALLELSQLLQLHQPSMVVYSQLERTLSVHLTIMALLVQALPSHLVSQIYLPIILWVRYRPLCNLLLLLPIPLVYLESCLLIPVTTATHKQLQHLPSLLHHLSSLGNLQLHFLRQQHLHLAVRSQRRLK